MILTISFWKENIAFGEKFKLNFFLLILFFLSMLLGCVIQVIQLKLQSYTF